jgi:hypothetical protein
MKIYGSLPNKTLKLHIVHVSLFSNNFISLCVCVCKTSTFILIKNWILNPFLQK